jgi:hypothetical protein
MFAFFVRLCFFTALAVAATGAHAQVGMTWTGMSAFGSGFGTNGFGPSGFGNAGFGASRFGSGGFGSRSFGTGGFGNAGFGASRFGGGGFGGGFGTAPAGFGGSVFGSQSFGFSAYGGGPNFIGRDSGDMAAVFNQMGRAGTQFFNQMNRNISRSARDRQPPPVVENVPLPLRVELEVAFDAPRPTPAFVANRLRARLEKILADHGIAQPDITLEGDMAVLRGVAASESERLLLEKLVMLEPGVRQVRNEMVVTAMPAASLAPTVED